MRASKTVRDIRDNKKKASCPVSPPKVQSLPRDMHISGAEGIYPKHEIQAVVQNYIARAREHPKGKPDSIVITIEKIQQRPKAITSLNVTTVRCRSIAQASVVISKLLSISDISKKAAAAALRIVQDRDTMRGAALVMAGSGIRVEPDSSRGIRTSRMGISRAADKKLSAALRKVEIDTQTVKEAIILASKVAFCPGIMAELCISDDPEYTTGYVASGTLGYVRIPHIKKKGDSCGGRVFFLADDADIPSVIQYLKKTPAIIDRISECHGTRSIDEILDRHHQ